MKVYVIESVYGGENFTVEKQGYLSYDRAVEALDARLGRCTMPAGQALLWYHDGQCDTAYYSITEVEICV